MFPPVFRLKQNCLDSPVLILVILKGVLIPGMEVKWHTPEVKREQVGVPFGMLNPLTSKSTIKCGNGFRKTRQLWLPSEQIALIFA